MIEFNAGCLIVLEIDKLVKQTDVWWKEGKCGLFYSMEHNVETVLDDRISRHTGIAFSVLRSGTLSKKDVSLIKKAYAKFDTWPGALVIEYRPGFTMVELCANIRRHALAHPLDFVLIDYWNRYDTSFEQDIGLFVSTIKDVSCVGMLARSFIPIDRLQEVGHIDVDTSTGQAMFSWPVRSQGI